MDGQHLTDEYMKIQNQLIAMQKQYLRLFQLLAERHYTIDPEQSMKIEGLTDDLQNIIKHEWNTYLLRNEDTTSAIKNNVPFRGEVLANSELSLFINLQPLQVIFRFPEYFFHSKVAKTFAYPYGNTKKRKLYFESEFWKVVIYRLTIASARTALRFLSDPVSKTTLNSPFHYLQFRIYSHRPLDVDQYEIRPLVNALSRSGWLNSDSFQHLKGYSIQLNEPNDYNSGIVELELLTSK